MGVDHTWLGATLIRILELLWGYQEAIEPNSSFNIPEMY
jgi:hypothetical protein